MAKLKVIEWERAFLHAAGLNDVLNIKPHIRQVDVYVAAPTKKAAAERLAELGHSVRMADLRVAMGNTVEAIVDLGLLETEGTVLVAPMMVHFGHSLVELRLREDKALDLVPVAHARRDRDARNGYQLVRLSQEV